MGGRLKINAVQGHECRFVCACTCDTVISELNFTPCGFAIVRPRGTVDGQQGEDKARNLHRIKKVEAADRGREKVFIHPEKTNVRGWSGDDGGGRMSSTRRSRITVRATLSYKKAIWTVTESFRGKIQKLRRICLQGFARNKFGWENLIFISICPVLLPRKKIPLHHQHESDGVTSCNSENISISISTRVYTHYESFLMRFISAVIKGADTNPCVHLQCHEVSLRQLNTPRWFVHSRYTGFFPLCQSVTVISGVLIKANYIETGRHNSFLIKRYCCCVYVAWKFCTSK